MVWNQVNQEINLWVSWQEESAQAENGVNVSQLPVRVRKQCVVAVSVLRNMWREEAWKRKSTLNILQGYFYCMAVYDSGKNSSELTDFATCAEDHWMRWVPI